MSVRKSFSRMPQPERDAFLAALLQMKNTIANPGDPFPISIYDQFVLIHNAADAAISLGGAFPVDPAHQGSAFGPWHREFLLRFELELQKFDSTVMLPYWDWTDGPGNMNIIFNEFGMGPNGTPANQNRMQTGYFAPERPGTGSNTTPLPAWYPATMMGWHCDTRLVEGGSAYNNIRRNIGSFANLATQTHVQTTLNTSTGASNTQIYMNFRSQLEAGTRMHNAMHNWFGIGSHMRNPSQSPNDPMFFLHHCNCDRLWAMWQMDGHAGNSFYQVAGANQGHNFADPMWPWIGGLPNYTSSYVTGSRDVLPDYSSESPRTASDVMDHRNIMLNGVNVGYAYDSQVVVGLALDRTGSMTGPTPDPLTGMPPNIPKWDAAKLGVGHFLQDAEAAQQAGEAYVVGGVNTFRSSGGVNEITPVASVTPKYGLIKTGSPYAQAAYNADIAGVTAEGGTPLAAALSETEDNLVRPPFGDSPDAEQRYLCILTDGIETAFPFLSSLGTPEFPDTVIFALGFGVGSGWNGVDYATIANMVSKGKAAPTGVLQTFHGENANVINKFFTNSIAHSLGFDAATDPRYEVFPGEMVMTPFEVTCGDQVFMITVQGFDFNDKNWAFHLVGPDGQMYMKAIEKPYKITMVRREARLTLFLNRNHGPAAGWEGTWHAMATYKPDTPGDFMYMEKGGELMIHAGAPPLLGPRYLRFNQPAGKRVPVRLLPPKANQTLPHPRPVNTGDPATVAINVYSKGNLAIGADAKMKKPYAGNPIQLDVHLKDLAPGKIQSMQVTGRLIAPKFSLGNILLDFDTIPKSARDRYQLQDDTGESKFDILSYLADYERKKPDAFELRDEIFELRENDRGGWTSTIRNTPFPGVYQFGVQIEGIILRPNGCEERVFRVVNTEVAVGIQPKINRSHPKLTWVEPDRFVVRFTATDSFGNIGIPDVFGAAQLLFQRQAVKFERQVYDDGSTDIVVFPEGDDLSFDKSGQCFKQSVSLKTHHDQTLKINAGVPVRFKLRLGATVLPIDASIDEDGSS